jgi:nucleoside-diphosphate-sugar epimerase
LRKYEILPQFSEFDVGTGEQISIKEFVLKLKDTMELICNKPIPANLNFGSIPYRKGEIMEVAEDVKPLFNLGWKPNITLTEGLKIVVKEFLERGKI